MIVAGFCRSSSGSAARALKYSLRVRPSRAKCPTTDSTLLRIVASSFWASVRVHGFGLEIFPPHGRVCVELLAYPFGVAFGLPVSWLAHEVT